MALKSSGKAAVKKQVGRAKTSEAAPAVRAGAPARPAPAKKAKPKETKPEKDKGKARDRETPRGTRRDAPAPVAAPAERPSKKKAPAEKPPTRARRKSHLTPKVLERLRRLLLAKRQELLGAVASTKGDSRQQTSDGTEDYIDYAVNSYDKEFLLSLTEMEQRELMLVEEALQRMERREYGYCLASGEEIPLKRLEVQPWARYSVRFQELEDQGMLSQESGTRPSLDAVEDPLETAIEEEWEDDDELDDADETEDEDDDLADPDSEEGLV